MIPLEFWNFQKRQLQKALLNGFIDKRHVAHGGRKVERLERAERQNETV